ncbi:MAG: CDP-glycerol glycerophosphotransferase family protein, partial [Fibrobacter sp.]|nr:CDP-glycerol glycerophosphotransferase family protein [Fibrobacter sp.]
MSLKAIRNSVRSSNFPLIKGLLGLRKSIHHAADRISFTTSGIVYYLCRLLPLQDKIVGSTFWGRKYGDNTQFVLEELHRINPGVKIVWIRNFKYKYDIPQYMRAVSHFAHWRTAYEYATAKVWLDTHRFPGNARKRKGQLVIETWHGGLGIKKLDLDVPKFR